MNEIRSHGLLELEIYQISVTLYDLHRKILSFALASSKAGISKLRLAGRMRPGRALGAARGLFLT